MKKPVFEKPFIFTMILVLIAAVGFFGFWYYRDQIFTKEVLKLQIAGPATAAMGAQVAYRVTYKNTGNFTLESPRLVFELPGNSLSEDGKTRFIKDLKDIKPGHQDVMEFPARLLGKESDMETAHAWLSYVPHNLSVRYESDASFQTKIDAVPIDIIYDLPSGIERGKEMTYSVTYFSNVDYPLENLSIKLDPLPGFKITSATPSSIDKVEWKLPVLEKSKGGKITVKGMVGSDSPDQLQFSAHLGMWRDGDFIILKEVTQTNSLSGVAVVPPDTSTTPPQPDTAPDTHVTVRQEGYHQDGDDFENSGPIPPEVGVPTTYTVLWEVESDIHALSNVTLSALLPANVTLAAVSPESQIPLVHLDGATGKLQWTIANLPANSEPEGTSANSISFQFTLIPAASEQGDIANIIGRVTAAGKDKVTGNIVSDTDPAINTNLPDDAAHSGGGIVK